MKQAMCNDIQSKVMLILSCYPRQGVDLPLLATITREFLRDDGLRATREQVVAVIESMNIRQRTVKGKKRYFGPPLASRTTARTLQFSSQTAS